MSGTTRPSSSRCAFQSVNEPSSSDGSCPRSASRTGWAESGVTRYWYQEISHATVTTTSGLTPESGTIETRGSPRLFAIPPTVRRYCDALKWSAASTVASSGSERRRRIGSVATGSWAGLFGIPSRLAREKRLRLRTAGIVGVVGAPSLTQPYSTAVSWQSGQTSTYSSPPFGEKPTARSPIRSVRSQIEQARSALMRVIRMRRGYRKETPAPARLCRGFRLRARARQAVAREPAAHLVKRVHVLRPQELRGELALGDLRLRPAERRFRARMGLVDEMGVAVGRAVGVAGEEQRAADTALRLARAARRERRLERHRQLARPSRRARRAAREAVVDLDHQRHDAVAFAGLAVPGVDERAEPRHQLVDRGRARGVEVAAVDDVGDPRRSRGVLAATGDARRRVHEREPRREERRCRERDVLPVVAEEVDEVLGRREDGATG